MAKILGQLEKAQFENVTGDPSTALAAGRVWADITTPAASIPKFYDGTNKRQLAMQPILGTTPGAVSNTSFNNAGNSGTAITIDWSIAPAQQITLTAHCVVSFSNPPASGQQVTLTVLQDATTPFQVRFNSDVYWQRMIAVTTPIPLSGAKVFKFISKPAFLAAISTVANPYFAANTSNGAITQAVISPDGKWVAYAAATNVVLLVVPLSTAAAKYNTLGTYITYYVFPQPITCVAWHPSSNYVVVGMSVSPFIGVIGINGAAQSQMGPIANPAVLPAGVVNSVDFSPSGDAIIAGNATTPFLEGWQFINSAFGNKYGNPATLPPSSVGSVRFNPSGSSLAISYAGAPGISIYAWTTGSGFGAKSANPTPATLVATNNTDSIAWSKNGNFVGLASTVTPFINIWPVSTSNVFGTRVTNPATLPNAAIQGMNFSAQDDFVVATQVNANALLIYPFTASGAGAYGTQILPVTPPPSASILGAAVSPDNEGLLWWGGTTPFTGVYQMPRVAKNYIGANF